MRRLRSASSLWWAGVVVLVCLVARIAYWRVAIGEDTGGYLYVGETILHGGMPYVDAAEPKGPVLHLLFALIRLVSGTSAIAVRLTLLPFVVVAALAVGGWVARTAGVVSGRIAAVAMALLGAMAPYDGFDPNSEQYGTGLLALAWLLATVPSLWAAGAVGALLAAAVGMNVGFAPVVVPVAIVLWPTARRIGFGRAALALCGGALLVIVPVVVWLAAGDALGEAKRQVWDFSRTWASGRFATAPARSGGIRDLLMIPAGSLWLLGFLGALVAVRVRELRVAAISAAAWIVVMLVRVKLNRGYEYAHHYYPGIPGIVAGIALGVHALTRSLPRERVAVAALVLTIPVWSFVVAPEWAALGQGTVARGGRFAWANPVARYIDDHTRPDDPVFVAGSEAEVYWLAHRRAPTRWFVNYVLYVYPQDVAERRRDLRRRPPAAVAVIAPETPADLVGTDVADLLAQEHYVLGFNGAGASVYLRPDRARGAAARG